MTWAPEIPNPRTWTPGQPMLASQGNEVRDQEDYLLGYTHPEGVLTLASGAAAGEELLTVTEDIETEIPVDTVLYFAPGVGKPARLKFPAPEEQREIHVYPLEAPVSAGDYAPFPVQKVTDLPSALRVPALGTNRTEPRMFLRHPTDSLASLFRFLAEKATATADSDKCRLVLGLRTPDGNREELVEILAYRSGSASFGDIEIRTASGGVFPATPAIVIKHSRRVGINTTGPNYQIEVNGDLDITGLFLGIALWAENTLGTLSHVGDARVTDQIISTVADGTPPFQCGSGARMVRNLNVNAIGPNKRQWPGLSPEDADTATVSSANVDVSVASEDATEDAIWDVVGQVAIDCDAADVGAKWTVRLKTAAGYFEVKAPELRLMSARKVQISVQGLVQINATDTAELIVRKNAGTGSTPVKGSIKLSRYN